MKVLSDYDYEKRFIGSCIDAALYQKRHELGEIAAWFEPRFLIDEVYQRMYVAILELLAADAPLDDRTILAACVQASGSAALVGHMVSPRDYWWHIRFHALGCYELYRRRSAADEAEGAKIDLETDGTDTDQILQSLGSLETRYAPPPQTRVVDNTTVIDEMLEEIIQPELLEHHSVDTGLADLDQVSGRMRAGNLVVVGARTGDGKSSFAGHVAAHVAFSLERHVLFFSLEMSNKELAKRWSCWLSRQRPNRSREFIEAASRLQATKNLQHFSGTKTVAEISQAVKGYAKTHRVGLVVVDYIGLVKPSAKADTREQEIANSTRAFKELAILCGAPVIAIAQLNRQATKEGPKIQHLRDSGAIEQDADLVLLLYPEENRDSPVVKTQIAVAKNRHGSQGVVQVAWQPAIFRYDNLAREDF